MSEQRLMKSYEELSYRDDFMFGKVMEDSELCREVLECLLQRPISELKEVQTQREVQYSVDGKPIRLDLYNEDSDGRVYDVEMQNLNHKKTEDLQLSRRILSGNTAMRCQPLHLAMELRRYSIIAVLRARIYSEDSVASTIIL